MNKIDALGHTIQIDYFSLNVTVSPLYDVWFSLVNGSGTLAAGGENFTRGDVLEVSALWNASGVNSSYVWMNASGTVSEYAFLHTDENDNWTNATFDFVNYTLFPRAGNVSVKLKAYDTFFQQNYTSQQRSFFLWGNANVSGMSANGSICDENLTFANGTYHVAWCLASDQESGAALSGYNVSFYVNHSYTGSALSNTSGWASLPFLDNSTDAGSFDLRCNTTGQQDIYYSAGAGFESNETVYVITDTDVPYFTDQWFEHMGTRITQTNLYRNASIVLSAADGTTSVSSVLAEVNYTYVAAPGYAKNWSMEQRGDGNWTLEFDGSEAWKSLNGTGNVTVMFYIYDTVGNVNGTWDPSKNALYVNAGFTVSLRSYAGNTTLYNRGENLTIFATDVNGFLMAGANWTANLTKYGQALSGLSTENKSYWNLTLNASEPPGNWTIFANASWMGNYGNSSFAFNVTDALDSYFSSPSDGAVYQPNAAVPVSFRVDYARGGAAAWNVTVNLTCEGVVYTLIRSGNYYVLNGTDSCTAPTFYSTSFSLSANVTCPRNNTNTLETVSLSTASEGTGGTTGRTSSSGISGAPVCNCTAWENEACGAGNCTAAQVRQVRTCTPAGCMAEAQCLKYSSCSLSGNFNLTAISQSVTAVQGGNATARFTLENTGNLPLTFTVGAQLACCAISFPGTLTLREKEASDVLVRIHAPLSEAPGSYTLMAEFSAGGIGKNRTVEVTVAKSPMTESIESLREDIAAMEAVLDGLKGTGIDLSALEEKVSAARQALAKAEGMAENDDSAGLAAALSEASSASAAASSDMLPARLMGFIYSASLELLGAAVLLVMITYILTQAILPPLTLERKIRSTKRKLDEVTKTKRDTEIQYFKRKIDEPTYKKIIADKHAESNTLEVRLRELEKEKDLPIGSKLSPGAVGRWLTGGPRRLAGRLRPKKKQDKLAEIQRKLAAAAQGQGKQGGASG